MKNYIIIVFIILQFKIAMSNFTTPTRRMMALLLGVRNFEPNIEARDLLEDIYLEDVSTLVLLHSQNQTEFAAHYDNISNNRVFIDMKPISISKHYF